MEKSLKQVQDIDRADTILFVNGDSKDFTIGKMYPVHIDDDGTIFDEGEHYVYDDLHIANTAFFYNPLLEIKCYVTEIH